MSTPPPVELGEQLIRLVKLMHAARHHVPQPRPDVDPGSYSVMFLIWGGESRVSDLAIRMHADISTVSRQVTTLVERGLVERGPDPHDGRAQVLAITQEGKDLVRALRARRNAWLDEVLVDWSEPDRAALTAMLDRLSTDIEASISGSRHVSSPASEECL